MHTHSSVLRVVTFLQLAARHLNLAEWGSFCAQAKADYLDELAHAAAESNAVHSELNRDLKALSDAKRVRDVRDVL